MQNFFIIHKCLTENKGQIPQPKQNFALTCDLQDFGAIIKDTSNLEILSKAAPDFFFCQRSVWTLSFVNKLLYKIKIDKTALGNLSFIKIINPLHFQVGKGVGSTSEPTRI